MYVHDSTAFKLKKICENILSSSVCFSVKELQKQNILVLNYFPGQNTEVGENAFNTMNGKLMKA